MAQQKYTRGEFEQSALVDEALARLHDAECAIRRLQVSKVTLDSSVSSSVPDGNSSYSDGCCAMPESSTGTKDIAKTNHSMPSLVDNNNYVPYSVNGPETQCLEMVSENREAEDELPAPPDAVITESSEMQARMQGDKVVIRRAIIWTYCGPFRLPFFHPESYPRLFWLLCGMAFTFVDAICIPYTLAFDVQAEGVLLRWIIDIYLLVDVVVTFQTGYLNKVGVLITDPKQVWTKYLTTWCLFDIIAAFPWSLTGITGYHQVSRNIRVIRALRLAKILRLVKVQYIVHKIEPFVEGNYLLVFGMAILRVLFTLFIVCHWCSCLWFSSTGGKAGDTSVISWISNLPDEVQGLEPLENHAEYYVWSLYFTMTTMTTVGFGDITPTTTLEVRYCILFLGVSAIVFAGQLGILSDLISNLNTQGKAMRENKATLARYMNWRIVPKELRANIRSHCMFLWEKNEGNDAYEDILKDLLPPVLRLELCYHIYGGVIQNAPFLAWMADFPTVVKFLANVIENTFWSRGDFLFRYDTLNQSILLLLSGRVRVSKNERIVHQPAHDLSLPIEDRFYVPNKNVKKKVPIRDQPKPLSRNERIQRESLELMIGKDKVTPLNLPKAPSVKPRKSRKAISSHLLPLSSRGELLDDAIEPLFQSEMFISSWRKLAVEDEQQVRAAFFLQCHWRKRRKKRQERDQQDGKDPGKWNQRSGVNSFKSYSIKAPAFFGESCMWREELDSSCAKPYGYSAQCENLSETLAIETKHIKDLLERFSPWLQDRLDRFREDVCRHDAIRTGRIADPNPAKTSATTLEKTESRLPITNRSSHDRQPTLLSETGTTNISHFGEAPGATLEKTESRLSITNRSSHDRQPTLLSETGTTNISHFGEAPGEVPQKPPPIVWPSAPPMPPEVTPKPLEPPEVTPKSTGSEDCELLQ